MTHRFATAAAMVALAVILDGCPAIAAAAPPDRLDVNARQIESLGIRIEKAGQAEDYLLATLPAVVAPPPNARVAVAATFPGT
ncbi:MAG: hypothetical protein ACYCZX_19470, partial [Rhodospirillaceae bacterium]